MRQKSTQRPLSTFTEAKEKIICKTIIKCFYKFITKVLKFKLSQQRIEFYYTEAKHTESIASDSNEKSVKTIYIYIIKLN